MAMTRPDSAPRRRSHAGFTCAYGDAAESPSATTKGVQVLLRSGCAKQLFSFSVWLIFLLSSAPGAQAQVRFDTWTTENGLPQNSINDILQTRDGYLWLATNGGLVRFDGRSEERRVGKEGRWRGVR